MDDQQPDVKAEQAPAPTKKEAPIVADTKLVDGAAPTATSGKKKNSAKKQKIEHGSYESFHLLLFISLQYQNKCSDWSMNMSPCDQSFFSTPADESHVLADLVASANHQATHNDDAPTRGSGKKQKNETDKGERKKVLQNVLIFLAIYMYYWTI